MHPLLLLAGALALSAAAPPLAFLQTAQTNDASVKLSSAIGEVIAQTRRALTDQLNNGDASTVLTASNLKNAFSSAPSVGDLKNFYTKFRGALGSLSADASAAAKSCRPDAALLDGARASAARLLKVGGGGGGGIFKKFLARFF
jgi:hypothetical protein